MSWLKNLLLDTCLGLVAGTLVADLGAPKFFTWYHIPGGGEALCNCEKLVQETTHAMVTTQLVAAAVGGVIFAVGGMLLRGRRGRPTPPAMPA